MSARAESKPLEALPRVTTAASSPRSLSEYCLRPMAFE